MKNTPHELLDDFPEHAERIRELKAGDSRFAKLYDDYHEINRAVHRAETDIEPADDAHVEDMRKQRMTLKDELYALMSA